MNKAIGGTIWPQTLSNACAVADVVGLINYDYLKAGKSLKFQIAPTRSRWRTTTRQLLESASGDTRHQSTRWLASRISLLILGMTRAP